MPPRIRPDVLIVDEALSVGDAYFQHKSFDRIREFRKQGTTLLLVSHDKGAIQSICDRAILLNAGQLAMEGEPEAVMDYYNALLAGHQEQTVRQLTKDDGKIQTISGTGRATVADICLLDDRALRIDVVDVGQVVTLRIDVMVHAFTEKLILGYGIKDRLGQVIYGTNTYLKEQPLLNTPGNSSWRFNIVFTANLGPGTYSIQTALTSSDTHILNNYEWRDLALVFTVVNKNKPVFAGLTWMDPEITIEAL